MRLLMLYREHLLVGYLHAACDVLIILLVYMVYMVWCDTFYYFCFFLSLSAYFYTICLLRAY